ncbi:MAG TPA: ubiquinone/menaquinone biosynthesis methyltransferase [Acidimicrobiales bacterium]|nr:ubiquinone/menaquinone biosynthesis methyltransferase [Acidimicrobiales bacterium]
MSPRPDVREGAGDELPQGEAKVKAVRAMFDAIAPRYDLVNRVMTFGMDVGWRRATVAGLGLSPGVVIDIAAGTGDLCRELASAGHTPVGIDLSWEMLAHARTEAPLVQADALRQPLPAGSVDGATCGFALRNLADLPSFFAELARVVRPGGRIALLEVAEPTMPLMRKGHNLYFTKVVPLIGGWLSDAAAYRYLPRSVAYLPDPARLVAQLREAGFSAVHRRVLSGGIAQLLTATSGRP